MISFTSYFMEMNIPGVHLDGREGGGALISSDQAGSEQPDGGGRIPFLPSLDLAMRKLDQRLPQVLNSISTEFENTDTHIPVHPSLEYVAKVSPKATFSGRVVHTNGIPTDYTPRNNDDLQSLLPKNNIFITFSEDKSGVPINLVMTKPQYAIFKDMNGQKDVGLGMRIEVVLQRMSNDFRMFLPWSKGRHKMTPNYSNILGVRYGY